MITIYGLSSKALDRITDSIPNIIKICKRDRECTDSFTVILNDNTILKFYHGSTVHLDLACRIASIENHEFDKITLF